MACNPVNPSAVAPVVCPPTVVYRDFYQPQPFQVVHPVEIVNRVHVVPVPHHVTTYTERTEMAEVCSLKKKRRKR